MHMGPDIPPLSDSLMLCGDVVTTPHESFPYKVVFRRGDVIVSVSNVSSVVEGEMLIKEKAPDAWKQRNGIPHD